jgi:hypothetical protein
MPPQLTARLNAASAVLAFAQSGIASTSNTILPGCAGNGTTDDTTCVQNAITAAQGGVLNLGKGLYKITTGLTSPGQILIVGSGGGKGIYDTSCDRGLRIGTANIDLLTFQASGSQLHATCIDSVVSNTAGTGVKIEGAINSAAVTSTQINHAFTGISVSGAGANQNINAIIANDVIVPANLSGSTGILIGANSTGANTGDTFIYSTAIYCQGNGQGMVVKDAGGPLVFGTSIYGCTIGTAITPGANQALTWGYFTGTVLGDTSGTYDLLIDTLSPSARINGTNFVNSWTSNSVGTSVMIRDTGASNQLLGLHFVAHRSYIRASNTGFDIRAGTNVTIDSSVICSVANGSGTGITLNGAVNQSAIRNNTIGRCDFGTGLLNTGISVTQTSGYVGIITGNDMGFTSTPLNFAPATGASSTAIINNNIGLDNLTGTLTAAATVTLSPYPRFIINGATTVTTINGGWGNRQITMIATSGTGLTFATGGNICNPVTATQNQMITAYYDPGWGCWHIR